MNTKNLSKYKFFSFSIGIFLTCTYIYDVFNVFIYLLLTLFCISVCDFYNKKNL